MVRSYQIDNHSDQPIQTHNDIDGLLYACWRCMADATEVLKNQSQSAVNTDSAILQKFPS